MLVVNKLIKMVDTGDLGCKKSKCSDLEKCHTFEWINTNMNNELLDQTKKEWLLNQE